MTATAGAAARCPRSSTPLRRLTGYDQLRGSAPTAGFPTRTRSPPRGLPPPARRRPPGCPTGLVRPEQRGTRARGRQCGAGMRHGFPVPARRNGFAHHGGRRGSAPPGVSGAQTHRAAGRPHQPSGGAPRLALTARPPRSLCVSCLRQARSAPPDGRSRPSAGGACPGLCNMARGGGGANEEQR